MLKRLRHPVGTLLLLALIFNALSPLLAAAQMRQGELQTLAMCTAGGLQSVALSSDGKVLPGAPAHTPCPFCLLSACGPALASALPALPYLARQTQRLAIFNAQPPAQPGPILLPPNRGPPTPV
ncbi:MAG: DUF2946 family protein [Stenotrophobium sp.]